MQKDLQDFSLDFEKVNASCWMFVYCRYIPKQLISELVSGAEYGWVCSAETTKQQTADGLNNEILPDFSGFSNFSHKGTKVFI